MFKFHIGVYVEAAIEWINVNLDAFFGVISYIINGIIKSIETVLLFPPSLLLIAILGIAILFIGNKKLAIMSTLGFLIIDMMDLWDMTMSTVALVFSSALIALLIGIPVGILTARNDRADRIVRPILDFMQTMPAFVYLIPAVLFFGLGKVPGTVATVIFSMPPVARLTSLGIRQVPGDVIEAAIAFGSTSKQMLYDVQLPLAKPTIMAGINQTIMLSLSMVVISSMIGAGGLGDQVLRGITQFEIGLGFEAGLSVVILAMTLDRITQALNKDKHRK